MPGEKSGIKTKIFMAAILVFFSVLLALYVYNIISVNKQFASEESKSSTECLYLRFEILSSEIKSDKLTLEIKNSPSSTTDITSISIKNQESTFTKDTTIMPSYKDTLVFDSINFSKERFMIYPNNCEDFAKELIVLQS